MYGPGTHHELADFGGVLLQRRELRARSREEENMMCDPPHEFKDIRNQQRGAGHDSARQIHTQPQDIPHSNQPNLGTRSPTQQAAADAGGGWVLGVSPETRGDRSRGVARVRRDLESHVQTIKDRLPGGASQKAA